jgi:hypothetical protein
MQVFGRLGRIFLLSAAAAAGLAALGAVGSTDVLVLVGGILAATFLGLGVAFLLVQHRLFGNPKDLARIAVEGMPATGAITDIGATSGRIGANPIMKIGLNVNMISVTVRTVVPVHKAHVLQIGAMVPVRVDTGDPNLCVIDWDAVA